MAARIFPSSVAGPFSCGGVDDELDFAVLDHVGDVRPAFGELVDALDFNAGSAQHGERSAGGDDVESFIGELTGDGDNRFLVGVADGNINGAFGGERGAGGDLAFGEGEGEIFMSMPRDFAGGQYISGRGSRRRRGICWKGKTISLTLMCFGGGGSVTPSSSSVLPTITLAAILAQGMPWALLTKGTVREARGLTSMT